MLDTYFPTRLFNTIDESKWEELELIMQPDIVYERPGYPPLLGLPAVMQFYRHERVVAHGKHLITDVAAHEGRVSCHGHFSGISRKNASLNVAFCDFYVLKESRLSYRKTFFYIPAI